MPRRAVGVTFLRPAHRAAPDLLCEEGPGLGGHQRAGAVHGAARRALRRQHPLLRRRHRRPGAVHRRVRLVQLQPALERPAAQQARHLLAAQVRPGGPRPPAPPAGGRDRARGADRRPGAAGRRGRRVRLPRHRGRRRAASRADPPGTVPGLPRQRRGADRVLAARRHRRAGTGPLRRAPQPRRRPALRHAGPDRGAGAGAGRRPAAAARRRDPAAARRRRRLRAGAVALAAPPGGPRRPGAGLPRRRRDGRAGGGLDRGARRPAHDPAAGAARRPGHPRTAAPRRSPLGDRRAGQPGGRVAGAARRVRRHHHPLRGTGGRPRRRARRLAAGGPRAGDRPVLRRRPGRPHRREAGGAPGRLRQGADPVPGLRTRSVHAA